MHSVQIPAAPRLASETVELEPLRAEHADELIGLLADPALHEFTGGRPPTRAELGARIERQTRGGPEGGGEAWRNWVVRDRRSGAAVGTVQATITPARASGAAGGAPVAALAWVIGTEHQGRGFATAGAALVAAWLRGQGVRSLRAHIHPAHRASQGVARSLGLAPTERDADGEIVWAGPGPPPPAS